MTALLGRLFGRLPIGWLQLTHSRTRFAAAIAGVAFANLLVFVQLGIFFALSQTIMASYEMFEADILISSGDANTFLEGGNVPRQRMFEALSVDGVEAAAPVYVAIAEWTQADGNTSALQIFGIDPAYTGFLAPDLRGGLPGLTVLDTALLDTESRGVDKALLRAFENGEPIRFEINGRTITATDPIAFGGGFTADGYMIVSDQTFLRLFPKRISGAPDHVLVKVAAGASIDVIAAEIAGRYPEGTARVRAIDIAAAEDRSYQTTERPIGLIFGFGVVMGIMVGIVIVYQVLSTDVADHLREYATFKAMGYKQRFFLGVIFEEAVILALIGFVPGFAFSWIIYGVLSNAAGLPVVMEVGRAVAILAGTIFACSVSGAIATRRLASADPAELF